MKKYWPLFGAVGIASTIGLYGYVSRDPLYEESETEEFFEEETEYEPELPKEEIPVPYTKKEEKKQAKRKQKVQKHQTILKNKPYHPSLPKTSGLENMVEKEDDERPEYDLPKEERDKLTVRQLLDYWNESLNNLDYKVAETYSSDLKKRYELIGKKSLFDECYISDSYDHNLSDMIKNCKRYDYDSVFRKVMWMNVFFIPKYEKSIPNCEIGVSGDGPHYIKKFDPILLIQKGDQALEAIEYCK